MPFGRVYEFINFVCTDVEDILFAIVEDNILSEFGLEVIEVDETFEVQTEVSTLLEDEAKDILITEGG